MNGESNNLNTMNEFSGQNNNYVNGGNNKGRNGLTIFLIIVIIALSGLSLYLIMDKKENNSNNNENSQLENENNTNNNEEDILNREFAKELLSLYSNENKRQENGLFKDSHDNIRYVGSNEDVMNYVEFGFDGDIWRIVGIFETEKANDTGSEKLIKLIRENSVGNHSWDLTGIETGSYCMDQWGPSTYEDGKKYDGATLMKWLNANSKEELQYENAKIQKNYADMIEKVVWNTGNVEYTNEEMDLLQAYNQERTEPKKCDYAVEGVCPSVEKTATWEGNIGLVYASDYGYASSNVNESTLLCSSVNANCLEYEKAFTNNNWLYNNTSYWTLTTITGGYSHALAIRSTGEIDNFSVRENYIGVRPSVYLKSTVKIVAGDGSANNPYKIEL